MGTLENGGVKENYDYVYILKCHEETAPCMLTLNKTLKRKLNLV